MTLGGKSGQLAIEIASIAGDDTAGPVTDRSAVSQYVVVRLFDNGSRAVTLTQEQQFLRFAKDARVTIPALSAGEYRVEVLGMHIEAVIANVTIREGETAKLLLSLQRGAVVKLGIQNAELDVAAVQKAKVEVYDAQGARVTLGADLCSAIGVQPEQADAKQLIVTPLSPGTYRVVIKMEGYRDFETSVTVGRSEVSEQKVVLLKK